LVLFLCETFFLEKRKSEKTPYQFYLPT